jgi:hypothetical protein
MTILQALLSMNVYPIPSETVERICIERGLDILDEYSQAVFVSREFQLSKADVLMTIASNPDISEQDMNVSINPESKKQMINEANQIYFAWDDSKCSAIQYGFIGDNWNA